MAATQKQIDDLEAAIAEGALRVKYEDRDVTYRALADMERTLAKLKREIAGKTGPQRTLAATRRGTDCG